MLNDIWQGIITPQPVPSPTMVGLLGAVALAMVLLGWPLVRMLVTIVHEAGHAAVAASTGRQLSGIRLHSDTSGLTVSRGRPKGPGMVATLLAGYLAPGVTGLGAALALAAGYSVGLLWAWAVLLALMLLFIRNFYGLLVMVVVLAGVAAASWYLEPVHQSWIAYLLTWLLLLSAPRPTIELARRPARDSDAGQLARLTRTPMSLWHLVFLAATLACLVGGLAVLTPRVFDLI